MMESSNPEVGPESPKKKVRPSTTNLILPFPVAYSSESTDSISNGLENQHILVNRVAPTRRGRIFEEPLPGPESSREDPSIQEEVVSSSESSSAITAVRPVPSIGDADSPTKDSEISDQLDAEGSAQIPRNTKEDPEEK